MILVSRVIVPLQLRCSVQTVLCCSKSCEFPLPRGNVKLVPEIQFFCMYQFHYYCCAFWSTSVLIPLTLRTVLKLKRDSQCVLITKCFIQTHVYRPLASDSRAFHQSRARDMKQTRSYTLKVTIACFYSPKLFEELFTVTIHVYYV
jgi:hypothetical protein